MTKIVCDNCNEKFVFVYRKGYVGKIFQFYAHLNSRKPLDDEKLTRHLNFCLTCVRGFN